MPIFSEGQDPLDQGLDPSQPAGRMPTGAPEPAPFSGPGSNAVIGAAFRQNNPVVSVLDAITQSRPDMTPVPGYDPVQRLSGTENDDLIDQSLADVNPAQTDARIAKKQQEQQDRQTLAASGGFGTVASIAAGGTDPSWFIPIAGEVKGAEELGIAARALRGMGEGAVKSAVSETALQSSQVTRTPTESASNVATNTLLMGLVGGGMAMLNPAERTAAKDGIEAVRGDLSAPELPKTAPAEAAVASGEQPELPFHEQDSIVPHEDPEPSTLTTDLSAASSDHRSMKLAPILLPDNMMSALKQVPGVGNAIDYTGRVLMGFSPTLRIFSSASLVAKRALGDLAETALRFTQADSGITTARGGVPIDRLVKMQAHDGQLTNSQILRDQFVQYRQLADSRAPLLSAAAQDARGQAQGKLSFADFKTEVSGAMTSGDVHRIPEVQQAAQQIRQQVLEPVKRMAQRTLGPDGKPMLAEELEPPKGDKSFFPRVWNKQKLAANYNGAKKIFADWLEGEQGIKAAAKQRIQLFNDALQSHEATIAKLEARIEGRGDQLEAIENRQEEVQRLNKFAYQRSEEMSAPLDEMRQKIRDIQSRIQPHLDKLTSLAEDIKAEKEKFPEIKQADALIFKMIGAAQKLKDSKEIVDSVDSAVEYSNALDEVIGGFKGGIREASAQAKLARRELGADTLVQLEKAKVGIRKEIKPYLKQLNETRRNLRETREGRIQNARGGAVFETQIRNRGNALADQASGKGAQIDSLEEQLIRETENAKAMRAKIEKEIADWEGQSTSEAKSALKVRAEADRLREQKMAEGTYQGEGGRLTGADDAVDRAVKRILKSDRDLSREELERRAGEIVNRINTAPDGRLPYETASGGMSAPVPNDSQQLRGALNARDFAIPTSLVKDFVNTDTEHVISAHLRSAIPDIHLTDRFGDVEMQDVFRRLDEEYDRRLAQAKTPAQQIKLDNERKTMVRDLAATRDRIRGTYGWDLAKSQPNAARIANAARNFNLITDLGTSVFNRMTDSINAVYRHGFMNVLGDGYLPFFKSMLGMGDGFATAGRQSMKDLGVGVDSAIGHLSHQWGDVIDNYMPGSKFERALAWTANKSMMVNLHGPWTDAMKTVAGTVAAADFLRTAERISKGAHTTADIQRMAQAGIDPNMAGRIWEAYSNGGGQEFGKGTHVANTADWKDTHARDVFAAAIARDADMAVLTPGAEKPLWMSGPVVSLLGQYKSFVAAAHEKVLISNLQQMDARTLQGLVASLGMGMLSYRAYTLWSGAPTSDRPQDWIKEGISRSAILGWFSEINSMQAKFTGGKTDIFQAIGADKPLSRRQSNSALSELLGPTYSKLEGIAGGVNDASHGTWTATDTHKLRQAIFLQNLFAVRRLFDAAETGFNEQLGVKPLDRSSWPAH